MDKKYIITKIKGNKPHVFNPSFVYAKVKPNEYKYVNEYLNKLLFNKSDLSLESLVSTDSKTREHMRFRFANKELLLDLQERYAKFCFGDEKILERFGIYNFNGVTFREKNLPEIRCDRLRQKICFPIDDKTREDLLTIKKKALYPPQIVKNQNTINYQTWLIGKYKGQTILFRLYKEESRAGKDFKNANSCISLEFFVRGKLPGGKILVRSDFKPNKIHLNLFRDDKFVENGYNPMNYDLKLRYLNSEPDHTHNFTLLSDIMLPNYKSPDITVNSKEFSKFEDFEKDFVEKFNIDTKPMLPYRDNIRNASLIELADKTLGQNYSATRINEINH